MSNTLSPQISEAASETALLHIDHFTDPGCPFGFSAEPDFVGLRWFYGDQISMDTRMVVLSETVADYEKKGITPEMIQPGAKRLASMYGMPLNLELKPRLIATRNACLAFVAVREHQPERAERFLRALRVEYHSEKVLIDEPENLFSIAQSVGLDRAQLEAWMAEPATVAALEADVVAARSPQPAAHALNHKLADSELGRRYTCPSIEVSRRDAPDDIQVSPGMQAFNVYESLIANLAPEIQRADAAKDPIEVLEWAEWPLAAAEVAIAMDVDRETAAQQLADSGAVQHGGYWSVP
jgi:predicted DsbA family dithiol-disulfide isomerase